MVMVYDERLLAHPGRPLIGVDVDGALNALAPDEPDDYVTHTILGYLIRTRRDLVELLCPLTDAAEEGRCDLFWATMWEAAAPRELSPAIGGIGATWPYLEFTRPTDTSSLGQRREFQERMRILEGDGVYFKSSYVGDLAAATRRPVVWIDDECGDADIAYFNAREDISTSVRCVRTDPRNGLSEADVESVVRLL